MNRGKIGVICIVALVVASIVFSVVVLNENMITADGETETELRHGNIVATGGAVVIEGRPQQKFGGPTIFAEGFGDVSVGERGSSYTIRDVFWAVTSQDSRGNPFIIYVWGD